MKTNYSKGKWIKSIIVGVVFTCAILNLTVTFNTEAESTLDLVSLSSATAQANDEQDPWFWQYQYCQTSFGGFYYTRYCKYDGNDLRCSVPYSYENILCNL